MRTGVNVVRINSAHADMDGAARIVANVRSVVSESIAILIDTKGPGDTHIACGRPRH